MRRLHSLKYLSSSDLMVLGAGTIYGVLVSLNDCAVLPFMQTKNLVLPGVPTKFLRSRLWHSVE